MADALREWLAEQTVQITTIRAPETSSGRVLPALAALLVVALAAGVAAWTGLFHGPEGELLSAGPREGPTILLIPYLADEGDGALAAEITAAVAADVATALESLRLVHVGGHHESAVTDKSQALMALTSSGHSLVVWGRVSGSEGGFVVETLLTSQQLEAADQPPVSRTFNGRGIDESRQKLLETVRELALYGAATHLEESRPDWSVELLEAVEPPTLTSLRKQIGLEIDLDRVDAATAHVGELLEVDDSADTWIQAGLIHSHLGDPFEANVHYEIARKKGATLRQLPQLVGWVQAAAQAHDQAEETFRWAQEVSPTNTFSDNGFGWISMSRGDPATALPHFLAASEHTPDLITTLNIALAQSFSGDHAAAVKQVEKAVELSDTPFIRNFEFVVRSRAGQRSESLTAARAFLGAEQFTDGQFNADILMHLCGKITGEELESRATTHAPNSVDARDNLTRMRFYRGFRALLNDREEDARHFLGDCKPVTTFGLIECSLGRLTLAEMDG